MVAPVAAPAGGTVTSGATRQRTHLVAMEMTLNYKQARSTVISRVTHWRKSDQVGPQGGGWLATGETGRDRPPIAWGVRSFHSLWFFNCKLSWPFSTFPGALQLDYT